MGIPHSNTQHCRHRANRKRPGRRCPRSHITAQPIPPSRTSCVLAVGAHAPLHDGQQRAARVAIVQLVFHEATTAVAEAEVVDRQLIVGRSLARPGVDGGACAVPAGPIVVVRSGGSWGLEENRRRARPLRCTGQTCVRFRHFLARTYACACITRACGGCKIYLLNLHFSNWILRQPYPSNAAHETLTPLTDLLQLSWCLQQRLWCLQQRLWCLQW